MGFGNRVKLAEERDAGRRSTRPVEDIMNVRLGFTQTVIRSLRNVLINNALLGQKISSDLDHDRDEVCLGFARNGPGMQACSFSTRRAIKQYTPLMVPYPFEDFECSTGYCTAS